MNDLLRRRLEACLRVKAFGVAHTDAFSAGSRGHELFTALDATIANIQARALEHDQGTRESRQMSASKNVARDSLLDQLEAISRTSRSLALQSPGLEEKFRMPLPSPGLNLLSAARSFLANATPLKAAFVREELPADFLEELTASIQEFDTALNEATRSKGTKVSARAAQDHDIGKGMSLLRQLDVVITNKFRSNPAVLAEWTSASHVERHSARRLSSEDRPTSPLSVPPSTDAPSGSPPSHA